MINEPAFWIKLAVVSGYIYLIFIVALDAWREKHGISPELETLHTTNTEGNKEYSFRPPAAKIDKKIQRPFWELSFNLEQTLDMTTDAIIPLLIFPLPALLFFTDIHRFLLLPIPYMILVWLMGTIFFYLLYGSLFWLALFVVRKLL